MATGRHRPVESGGDAAPALQRPAVGGGPSPDAGRMADLADEVWLPERVAVAEGARAQLGKSGCPERRASFAQTWHRLGHRRARSLTGRPSVSGHVLDQMPASTENAVRAVAAVRLLRDEWQPEVGPGRGASPTSVSPGGALLSGGERAGEGIWPTRLCARRQGLPSPKSMGGDYPRGCLNGVWWIRTGTTRTARCG